jgi:molecular chaperone GrpE (heat shock protein)
MFGAERIAAEGERFDPALHEALGVLPVSEPALDGRVVKEWLRGYRLGSRVLRPARVMVGKQMPS